ncbi:unnamed protein product [Phytomonas sp. EM1]|nr:unnamed protein product [Phytomonas sp. EM1]|eukprot:CCW61197.1 unnamed protein product [Phytomonas sp. isolate EM1]
MCKPSKGFVGVEGISRHVGQAIHSSSALPPAPSAMQLHDFLRVLRENYVKDSEIDTGSETSLKQPQKSLSPSSVKASLMKTELVQSGAYPTDARVRSCFAACGTHSVLGSFLQWFSEAILMLFTNGLESVASFPEQWEMRLQEERVGMSSLHQYMFELQGFGILFSYLWCRLAMLANLSQGSPGAETCRDDMEEEFFPHGNTNCKLFRSVQAGHSKSRPSHQRTHDVGKVSHVSYSLSQLPMMGIPLKNEASKKETKAFLCPITSLLEQREALEGTSSACGMELEAVGRSPNPVVPQMPAHSHVNLLNFKNSLSRGSHVTRICSAVDRSNDAQPAKPSINQTEAYIKGYAFTSSSQKRNPGSIVRMPPVIKHYNNSSDVERGIMKTRAYDHAYTQVPYSEDSPIELASRRCLLLPPRSNVVDCQSKSGSLKPNSSSVRFFRLDDTAFNSSSSPTIDPVVMRKQGKVRAMSIEEFEQGEREKALKKLYGVQEIKNYAHERDVRDFMRHLDELRDSLLKESTNNMEPID